MALPYLDTDQVWVWFWSIYFSRSYGLGLRKKSRIISFPDFFSLCLHIFIWYLVHCFAIPRYRLRLSLVLIHWLVMAHGLRKTLQIVSFLHFGRLALQSQIVFSFVFLELLWWNIPPVGDLVLLAILSECLFSIGHIHVTVFRCFFFLLHRFK
jgi:hypothetical protein